MYSDGMTTASTTEQRPGARERLLVAMADLIWERGYAATSPRDVMRRADAGQGSLYHHFSGKHDLAVAALRYNIEQRLADADLLTGPGSPLARLLAYLTLPRNGPLGCPVGRMTQDPQVLADPELLGLVRESFDGMAHTWATTIQEALDAGELPSTLDPEDLAATLMSVLQGGYVLSKAAGSQAPMDAAVRGAAALLRAAAAVRPTTSIQKEEDSL